MLEIVEMQEVKPCLIVLVKRNSCIQEKRHHLMTCIPGVISIGIIHDLLITIIMRDKRELHQKVQQERFLKIPVL